MDTEGGFIHPEVVDSVEENHPYENDDSEDVEMHPLSKAQERRLVEYLETKLLDINRSFKKR